MKNKKKSNTHKELYNKNDKMNNFNSINLSKYKNVYFNFKKSSFESLGSVIDINISCSLENKELEITSKKNDNLMNSETIYLKFMDENYNTIFPSELLMVTDNKYVVLESFYLFSITGFNNTLNNYKIDHDNIDIKILNLEVKYVKIYLVDYLNDINNKVSNDKNNYNKEKFYIIDINKEDIQSVDENNLLYISNESLNINNSIYSVNSNIKKEMLNNSKLNNNLIDKKQITNKESSFNNVIKELDCISNELNKEREYLEIEKTRVIEKEELINKNIVQFKKDILVFSERCFNESSSILNSKINELKTKYATIEKNLITKSSITKNKLDKFLNVYNNISTNLKAQNDKHEKHIQFLTEKINNLEASKVNFNNKCNELEYIIKDLNNKENKSKIKIKNLIDKNKKIKEEICNLKSGVHTDNTQNKNNIDNCKYELKNSNDKKTINTNCITSSKVNNIENTNIKKTKNNTNFKVNKSSNKNLKYKFDTNEILSQFYLNLISDKFRFFKSKTVDNNFYAYSEAYLCLKIINEFITNSIVLLKRFNLLVFYLSDKFSKLLKESYMLSIDENTKYINKFNLDINKKEFITSILRNLLKSESQDLCFNKKKSKTLKNDKTIVINVVYLIKNSENTSNNNNSTNLANITNEDFCNLFLNSLSYIEKFFNDKLVGKNNLSNHINSNFFDTQICKFNIKLINYIDLINTGIIFEEDCIINFDSIKSKLDCIFENFKEDNEYFNYLGITYIPILIINNTLSIINITTFLSNKKNIDAVCYLINYHINCILLNFAINIKDSNILLDKIKNNNDDILSKMFSLKHDVYNNIIYVFVKNIQLKEILVYFIDYEILKLSSNTDLILIESKKTKTKQEKSINLSTINKILIYLIITIKLFRYIVNNYNNNNNINSCNNTLNFYFLNNLSCIYLEKIYKDVKDIICTKVLLKLNFLVNAVDFNNVQSIIELFDIEKFNKKNNNNNLDILYNNGYISLKQKEIFTDNYLLLISEIKEQESLN